MNFTYRPLISLTLASVLGVSSQYALAETTVTENHVTDSESSQTLDYNEQTHLEFMREEEKLARDVYTVLGSLYPDSPVFGNIDDSEQRHTNAVRDILEKYNVPDPNTNDNVGVYTGTAYGWYFTEKYQALVDMASNS